MKEKIKDLEAKVKYETDAILLHEKRRDEMIIELEKLRKSISDQEDEQ